MSNLNKKVSNHSLITGTVLKNLYSLVTQGKLTLPDNYNVSNAVQAAYLKIKETKDKNGNPALDVCTQDSIVQSVMNMAVQGLNPGKEQCYFTVYGNKLVMLRSYYGSVALAKRFDPRLDDIYADVVYEGDIFKIGRKKGKTVVLEHITELKNMDKKKIIAAYATALYKNGEEESLIMTKEDIHQAWSMSSRNVFTETGELNPKSTHYKFTKKMAKKTVLSSFSKKFINTTDDSILSNSINESEEDYHIAEAKETIDISANKNEFIDILPSCEEENEPEKKNYDVKTGEIIANKKEDSKFEELEELEEEELF